MFKTLIFGLYLCYILNEKEIFANPTPEIISQDDNLVMKNKEKGQRNKRCLDTMFDIISDLFGYDDDYDSSDSDSDYDSSYEDYYRSGDIKKRNNDNCRVCSIIYNQITQEGHIHLPLTNDKEENKKESNTGSMKSSDQAKEKIPDKPVATNKTASATVTKTSDTVTESSNQSAADATKKVIPPKEDEKSDDVTTTEKIPAKKEDDKDKTSDEAKKSEADTESKKVQEDVTTTTTATEKTE
ncbi:uncharacterized protein LOC119610515 [Lucilia sericata]|uniref:uncharacterized protein LOC119610515 n=1 Tax=Lucilia sericata TaxID=13632 RepID=UPI0018A7EB59|nr:uncharacterized protein LOC119610515 [Lucilia sericata]